MRQWALIASWMVGVASLPAYAQDAGRVLVAVGEVVVVRGSERLPASPGLGVRPGDTVELGTRSNAQIRFTDESIVALRSDTAFRVAEYEFDPRQSALGRAFFNLLKGGMRTVTGVIGRRDQANYGVRTATATIGIRGTHYTLVECDSDCRNADGSAAPPGTYGSVTDGVIGVVNESGERRFGADQYFHVASATAAPTQLLAPPVFLRDPLEGRTRTQQQRQEQPPTPAQQQAAAAQVAPTVAPTAPGGGTGDPRVSAATASSPLTVASITTNVFQETNTISTLGPAAVIEPGFTGTVFYRITGPFNIPIECSGSVCPTIVAGQIGLSVNFALQRAVVSTVLLTSFGTMYNLSTPLNTDGFPITIEGGEVRFGGEVVRSDPRFVEQTGSFRCSNCSASAGPGFVDRISVNGVITGGIATLVLSESDAQGTGTIRVSLPQATPPNNSAAAMVIQACTANCGSASPTLAGATATSSTQWNVTLDGSGRLVQFGAQNVGGTGPANASPGSVGRLTAFVGTATNDLFGSDASAGNLVWGRWVGPGARITDGNYVAYTTGNNQRQPWITGDFTNTLPPSLGTQTYSLIPGAAAFSSDTQRVNSATLTADFVNRQMTFSVNVTNAASATNTNTYQSTGSSAISPITSRFSAGFSTTTCTGPCNNGTSRPDGSFSGFFAGTQAQGAGVALTVGFGANALPGVGAGVSGVIGLKR